MHANEQWEHQCGHTHTHILYMHACTSRNTTLHSTSHNLDEHIYAWFLCREGRTLNVAWQDRHIFPSGRILRGCIRLNNMYCGCANTRQRCGRHPFPKQNDVPMPLRSADTVQTMFYMQVYTRIALWLVKSLCIFFIIQEILNGLMMELSNGLCAPTVLILGRSLRFVLLSHSSTPRNWDTSC